MENRSLADDLPKRGESDASGRVAEDPAASALARRPDFQLGSGVVRPSVRTVQGPGGSVSAEPSTWCSVDAAQILQDMTVNEGLQKLEKKASKFLDKLFNKGN